MIRPKFIWNYLAEIFSNNLRNFLPHFIIRNVIEFIMIFEDNKDTGGGCFVMEYECIIFFQVLFDCFFCPICGEVNREKALKIANATPILHLQLWSNQSSQLYSRTKARVILSFG